MNDPYMTAEEMWKKGVKGKMDICPWCDSPYEDDGTSCTNCGAPRYMRVVDGAQYKKFIKEYRGPVWYWETCTHCDKAEGKKVLVVGIDDKRWCMECRLLAIKEIRKEEAGWKRYTT